MRRLFIILSVALMLPCVAVNAQKADVKVVEELYAFGYATTFSDSIVYLTDIQKMPPAKIVSKNGFLVGRSEYSGQLKTYIESLGGSHPTCAIIFDKKRDKLMKKMNKLVKKKLKEQRNFIKYISNTEFTFQQLEEEEE